MKRFFTLLSGLLLAAVIGLAQGKWEQISVTPYGTGGINRSGERIDNSYSAGKFNSEVKSTSKDNPYVYFRKGQFSVPAKTYQPGQTFPVSISLTVKRHSGTGTPKGNAGAILVAGKAGQGTSVPSMTSVSGVDAGKGGAVTLTIPTHASAGNNFSIVYSCFDIKVVYLYRWLEDKPAVTEQQTVVATDEIVMEDDTILPPADSVAAFEFEEDVLNGEEEPEPDPDSLALAAVLFGDETLTEDQPEEEKKVKAAPEKKDAETFLSIFGMDLTKKDTIMYGIIGGLGLLVLILLLVLLFRKNPAKKAAKEEAKRAAAEAKAAARAEAAEKAAAAKAAAAEKAAAMKAEREAKLAEQKAAAAEKAAAAKAAQEAAKAERDAKLAEQKAAQEAKAAELKKNQEAAKAEREAKLAEQKAALEAKKAEQAAKQAELKAAREAKLAEQKAAQEARMAELKAKKEAAAAPAAKRFCENCGAPLAPDAVFCENCGTKVS